MSTQHSVTTRNRRSRKACPEPSEEHGGVRHAAGTHSIHNGCAEGLAHHARVTPVQLGQLRDQSSAGGEGGGR